MFPFTFTKAADEPAALAEGANGGRYIAGGTTLIDLMRETVERPPTVIDINALPYRDIDLNPQRLRFGALVRMTDLATDPRVRTQFPVISEALELSASAQLRNMATIGGNIMQRPRCLYFRDVTAACNRREPGSGCPAIGGENRTHAVLGTSAECVATHPSDLAVALVALDATVTLRSTRGDRSIPISRFFRQPGQTPDQEHDLRPGELIVAVDVPTGAHTSRSGYLKVRDRQSYEFALTSAAVALDVAGGTVRAARVAVGG
ncbi:MAG: xanthine dehydrogenase YagS FAD-binding subunit, partial [Pseudonocardiales bacterium]|nr:xanthine dehydrogenase YagS FAD-binding subunit [Pseudonocardiales bacterium]